MMPFRLALLAALVVATPGVAQTVTQVANAVPECPAFDVVHRNVLTISGGNVESPGGAAPSQSQPVAAEIILDASGSMAAAMGSERKIDVARRALDAALTNLDSTDALVGLRAYGFDTSVAKTPEASCPNSALVSGFGAKAGADHAAAANALQPYGYTPIAASLAAAGSDLAGLTARERMIILITDGEETCNGDPVAAARSLTSAGIDVATYVVGFDLNAEQRAEMQAIAAAGGGAYFDAGDGAALTSAIQQAVNVTVEKSERRIEKCDNPVQGGTSAASATLVSPGLYTVGELIPTGEERFYRLDVPAGTDVLVRGLLQSQRWVIGDDGRPFETKYALGAMTLRTYDASGRSIGGRNPRARDVPGTTLEKLVTVEGDGGLIVSVGDAYDPVAPDALFALDILDAAGNPVSTSAAADADPATAGAPTPAPTAAEREFNFYTMNLDGEGTATLGQGAPIDIWRVLLPGTPSASAEGWQGLVSVLVRTADGAPALAYELFGERDRQIIPLAASAGGNGHRTDAADGGRVDALILILRAGTAPVPYTLFVYADG